jgi:hypothetical protein
MIINNQESNIQVIGDITEFKSSIDPKNLEFITTLLSSNLYSAPERSFIREIVSNAWDAQVEAGTTDIPIIIKITENITNKNSNYERFNGFGDITIRDFGTGLSPERFNDIYRNIGSSTKRESNDYHGAFGIGHLSGFSCSNTMYVTSYYNGTCYEYIGIKDANTIVYTLVSTTPTTEKSGLEVTLKNVYLEKYRKSLKYIMFFPNVYIDDNNHYDYYGIDINNVKIKKYTNFWVSSSIIRDKILLGNVLYPLNFGEINLKTNSVLEKFYENIKPTGIVLKFDIGELSVTPNRENIIYTKDCIAKITNKIEAAYKEITDIIEDNLKEDYTDIICYANLIQNDKGFDFFENKLIRFTFGYYLIPKSQVMHIKYKGKDISMYKDLFWYLTENISYCSKCMIHDSSVYNITSDIKSIPYKYKSRLNLAYIGTNVGNNNIKLVILKEDIKLGKYIKEYLININFNSKSNDIIVLYPLDLNTIKNSIKLATRLDTYNDTGIIDFIIQEIIDYIYSKGTVIDFNNDADFLKFRESRKEENKLNRKNGINYKDVIINVYNFSYCTARKHTFKNLDDAVKFLEDCHKGIVTIDRDTPDNIKDIILKRGFLPIFVNKKIREVLKEYSFNVELDWVINNDPYLSYYKTILEIFKEEVVLIDKLQALAKVVSTNYSKDIRNIIKVKQFERNCPFYTKQAELSGKTDESLKNRLLKIKDFLKKYEEASTILVESGINESTYGAITNYKYISLITKVLVKNKSFIVNATAYRSIKKNKLINILCKK